MDLTVFNNSDGFAALRDEWNSLLARSRSNTLFLTWEWQTTWWQCLGSGALYLLAWHDDGRLVGIAPLYGQDLGEGTQRLTLVGCVEVSDYLDLIVAEGYEDQVYASLLDWLVSPQAPAWHELLLCNLPQESLTHRRLPERAAEHSWHSLSEVEDVCPIIHLPADFESYLQNVLSKKQRHEVRRKLRRLQEEAKVTWYVVDATANLGDETQAFIRLHRLSKQEKHSFMTPEMQTFFEEIARVTHEKGWLYLAFIDIDGVRAAAMLCFLYNGRVFVYNSGYDPSSYAELSPGIALTTFVIEDSIQRGASVFDFLQGNEVYKYRFGAEDTLVYSTTVWRAA